MKRLIFKYRVRQDDGQTMVGRNPTFLYFDIQRGVPTVWYEVDEPLDADEPTFVDLAVLPTGGTVPNRYEHVASAMTANSEEVLHLYQCGRKGLRD